jgi:hypothetical protein
VAREGVESAIVVQKVEPEEEGVYCVLFEVSLVRRYMFQSELCQVSPDGGSEEDRRPG